MARFTEASLAHLYESIDIVDVITQYIDVRKVGANFMALCPFHDDKTPSMSISAIKGLYHCHACGASGNAIRFVMEYERLSFHDAAQKIAALFNVALAYEKGYAETKKSNLLPSLALFYHNNLFKHNDMLQYLFSRAINEDSINEFEIGYSGNSYDTLRFIDEQKLSRKEAVEYGVLTQGNDRAYARFANRIIFPIHSSTGVVVGFGGRTLSADKNVAKYLNSPQSKVFNKSKILYGYHLAKQMIYKQKSIIVCEGYLDVIMLHQAGFKNAVATLGTALNEGHLYLLNKDNPRIYMCYDGDNAGINAAFKAAKFLSQNSKDGGVIILKDGLDPADMIAQNKIELFKDALNNAMPFVEFALRHIIKDFDINNPMQKQNALKACKEYLHTLTPFLQDEYKQKCASLLQINPIYLDTKNQKTNHIEMPKDSTNNFAEESILYNMLEHKEHFYFAINFLTKEHFQTYRHEFQLICNQDYDNDRIYALRFKTKAKILNDEEFKEQLRIFLLQYAQDMLPKIAISPIESSLKFQQIKALHENIAKLKRGELVSVGMV